MKNRKSELGILILSIFIILLSYKYNLLSNTFLGFYTLFLSFLLLLKTKNNKVIFFFAFAIFYFNYSYIISRYIGVPSNMLQNIYYNINNDATMIIAIDAQILFFSIINFLVGKDIINTKNETFFEKSDKETFKYRRILVFIFEFFLLAILYYHIKNQITTATTILEYSLILFIFLLYFTKNNKIEKIVAEAILIVFCLYSLRNGDRIAILQLLISDFLINYVQKISIKKIVVYTLLGVFLFTFMGIYGDFLDTNKRISDLTFEYTFETLNERRFALDTSVAAYHAGATIIEARNYYTNSERVSNAAKYFTKYVLIGGSRSGYTPLNIEVKKYRYNLGGGYITSYFYFWGNWIGVTAIAIYVGTLLKLINKKKTLYFKLLGVFILSSFPRWYLYAPDLLFRGVGLFSLVFLILNILFINKKET